MNGYKDSKIFHKLFMLQRDILIFVIIKCRYIWLKSEFSLSWAKYDKLCVFDIQGKFICREPVTICEALGLQCPLVT